MVNPHFSASEHSLFVYCNDGGDELLGSALETFDLAAA